MNSSKFKDEEYKCRPIRDLKEMIDTSALLFGDENAFLVKDAPGGTYTPIKYSRVKTDIDEFGTALMDLGLTGKKIAVIGENRYEWVVAYLAIVNGVGVSVPLDRELPAQEIHNLLERSEASAIIYSSKVGSVVEEAIQGVESMEYVISMDALENEGNRLSMKKLLRAGKRLLLEEKRYFVDAEIDREAMCSLLFTSGTTGLAKGVMLSHKNITSNVYNMSKYVNISNNFTGLSVLPMHHTYELSCHVFTGLYQGCCIAICEGLKYIVKNMAESKATLILGVPLIFESMHKKVWKKAEESGKIDKMRAVVNLSKKLGKFNIKATKKLFKTVHQAMGGHMQLFISGAAAIDPVVIEDFNAMGFTMIQGYGMTECSPIIAVNKDRYYKPAAVGLPLPGTEVEIIEADENGIGEVICRSDSVMLGYYKNPEETAKVLMDGWLHTGDYGYFDKDGFLYLAGRKKNVIVTKNGKNIFPEEVEYYLNKCEYIREVIVWGVEDEKSGDTIVCAEIFPDYAAVEKELGKVTEEAMKRLLKKKIDEINEQMPLYKRVKRIELRDEEFDKTTTKKSNGTPQITNEEEREMELDQYKAIKEKEMEYAVKRVEAVKNSNDKYVMYRDIRPIIDLKQMVESSVELYGSNIAFHVKDKVAAPYRGITYREAKADMDALGTALTSLNLSGKRIAIIGENRYEWAISYLAVVCGTGIVVPLDKELGAPELAQLIKEAGVECVIYGKKYESIFKELKDQGETKLRHLISMDMKISDEQQLSLTELIGAGKVLIENGNRVFLDAQIERDAMGIILFTSGTTGIAKGVMLSHGNIVEDLMASPTLLEVLSTDVFFSILPLHHTYECTCGFLMPFYRGASIAYCEGLKYIVKNLAEARPTIFLGVPLIIESLHKKIWQNAKKSGKAEALKKLIAINRVTKKIGIDLAPIFFKQIAALFGGRMKVIICGGAAIDPAILQGIRDFGINALQGYGLTECAPICALNPDKHPKNNSAGYIPPGFDIKIHEPDPETGIGEICAKGGNVMLGYYNNPEATAEVLIDGWFHTGDMGYLDEERFVHITGRIKNVIITKNGKNVYPEEIENYLGRIPYIQECLVWGRDSDETGETLIFASIRADEDAVGETLGENYTEEDVKTLIWKEIDIVNSQIPYFQRIKKISIRKEEFEKTTGKKIKRFVEGNKRIDI